MSVLKIVTLIAGAVALLATTVNAQADGYLIRHTFFSNAENRTYAFHVYYPPGYQCSNLKYPILYLLHGHSGDEFDWTRADRGNFLPTANALIQSGAMPPTVVIIPGDQYSWWINGYVRRAEDAFLYDLMPHVENTLLAGRVMTERAGRMIGGLSAGGYGSIRMCMLYPDLWVAAAPLSPAIYTPTPTINPISSARLNTTSPFRCCDGTYNDTMWVQMNWPSLIDAYIARGWNKIIPMYLNSGDFDRFRIAYHVADFFNTLWDKQPNITSIVQLRIVSGDHDWPVWRDTIGEAMIFMHKYAARPVTIGGMQPTQGFGPGCINPPPSSSSSSTGLGAAPTLAPSLWSILLPSTVAALFARLTRHMM